MRHSVTLLLLATACGGNDYSVAKDAETNPGAERPVDLAFDVAFQENRYGEFTSRCQVQVAFSPVEDTAAAMPGASGPPPPDTDFPEAPGTCVFTERARPDPGGDPGGSGEPGGDSEPGEAPEDGWQIAGSVIGPSAVWMRHEDGDLLLETVEVGQGGLRYELTECDAGRFPFSRTLGLDVPDAEDPDGVHAFSVPDLVAVGPRVVVDSPAMVGGGNPTHDPREPLPVRWTLDGPDPVIDGEPLRPNVRIQILNQDHAREEADRWLVCWPDEEGWFDVQPEDLAPLVEGREDRTVWGTQIGIHSEVQGPEQLTPWGRTLQVRAHVSAGGGIDLVPQ